MIRVGTCLLMAAARLIELRISRRNLRAARGDEVGRWSTLTWPVMVALHVTVLAVTAVRGRSMHPAWLAALIAVQPLRVWVLALLGTRWNARGGVPAGLEVETAGPYSLIRHPNYLVVAVELLALPLAFGLARIALVAAVVHAGVLGIRIAEEERALMRIPAYRRHFRARARLVPWVF